MKQMNGIEYFLYRLTTDLFGIFVLMVIGRYKGWDHVWLILKSR